MVNKISKHTKEIHKQMDKLITELIPLFINKTKRERKKIVLKLKEDIIYIQTKKNKTKKTKKKSQRSYLNKQLSLLESITQNLP
jgi:hypothetical protein